jgi:hypothetical protein
MQKKNEVCLSSSRYVLPGTYLYACVVVSEENDFVPSGKSEELPLPEELKRIALDSVISPVHWGD